jgi:hypothetical protein
MCGSVAYAIGGAVLGSVLGKKKSGGPPASLNAKSSAVKNAANVAQNAPAPTQAAPSASGLPSPAGFGGAVYDRAQKMAGRDSMITELLAGAAGGEEANAGGGKISDAMRNNNFRRKLRNRGGLSLQSGSLGSGDSSKSGTGVNFNA